MAFDPDAYLDQQPETHAQTFDPDTYLNNPQSFAPKVETEEVTPTSVVAAKLLEGATALPAKVIGGYRGLWDLVRGKGAEQATRDIEATRLQPHYERINSNAGWLAESAMDQPVNPLNWGGDVLKLANTPEAQRGMRWMGQDPDVVNPFLEAAAYAGPLVGGLAARGRMGPPRIPQAPPELQAQLAPQYAGQSMGAAGATPNLLNATPELRTKVQEVLNSGQQLSDAGKTALSRHVEAESLPIPAQLTRGQALGDEAIKSEEFNAKGKLPAVGQRYEAQNQNLIDNLQALREQAGPEVFSTDAPAHGDTIINAYKTKDAAVKADISAKYQALKDANGGEFPVDGQTFAANARQALKTDMKAPFLPPAVHRLVDDYAAGEQMTFENFENLRTTLAAEARKAERAGDGNAARAVSLVRNSLEDLPMVGEAGVKLKMLADQARTAARSRFEALEADPAYKAAVNDSVPPDSFVKKFVISGTRDNVAKMRANLGHDEVAQQTMSVAALDHLREQSGAIKGKFSQEGYNKALRGMAPKLQSLVDRNVAEQLDRLGEVARWEMQQGRGGYYNNSGTFIAAAKEYAAHTAEIAGNIKGIPAGSMVRHVFRGRADKKYLQSTLEPGAGISD